MDTTQSTHRQLTTGTLLGIFVRWYMVQQPKRIITSYIAWAEAFAELFAFVFLLRTLFAPWKSITDAYPTRGLNINRILETFTLNMTARAVGCVVRLVTILTGLVAEVLLFACFAVYLAAWLVFPVAVPAAYIYLITTMLS